VKYCMKRDKRDMRRISKRVDISGPV